MCDVTIGGHYWTAGLGVDTADTDHRLCIGYGGNGGGWLLLQSAPDPVPSEVNQEKREETIVRTLLPLPPLLRAPA